MCCVLSLKNLSSLSPSLCNGLGHICSEPAHIWIYVSQIQDISNKVCSEEKQTVLLSMWSLPFTPCSRWALTCCSSHRCPGLQRFQFLSHKWNKILFSEQFSVTSFDAGHLEIFFWRLSTFLSVPNLSLQFISGRLWFLAFWKEWCWRKVGLIYYVTFNTKTTKCI